jgi:hypothetical protein
MLPTADRGQGTTTMYRKRARGVPDTVKRPCAIGETLVGTSLRRPRDSTYWTTTTLAGVTRASRTRA